MPKYNAYIELSPNYESVVDIDSDNRNPNLWREYIVHEDMTRAIEKICDSLQYVSKDARRSFWIHGAYGTGKSYSAIVLKHLFEDSVSDISDFMSGRYGSSAGKLFMYKDKFIAIREKGDFLVVWRSGCTGIRNGTELMMEMEVSIRERLAEKYGADAYYGENSIISSVQTKLDDRALNWHAVFEDEEFALYEDYADCEEFKSRIEAGDKDTCSRAAAICRKKGWGMFNSVERFEGWLTDIIAGNNLNDTGIIFIWDEFTDFVKDNGGDNVLQRLSEFCKQQPFIMFLIVHRSTGLVSSVGEEDYKRIMHRYHELEFHITESAAYDLIGNSIIVREGMQGSWGDIKNHLMQTIENSLADFDNLEPGFSRERLKNLCPIHPMTLSLLASVAQNFGASQRTLFRFIKDANEADQNVGFNYYISSNGLDDWRWLTADFLWDYFFTRPSDIKESFSSGAVRAYRHYMSCKDAVGDDAIAGHVFKTIMLLIAVMSSDTIGMVRGANKKLAATEGSLYKCLSGVLSEKDIDEYLDAFEKKDLIRLDRQASGDARLELPYSGGADKFEVRLEQAKRKYTRYTLFANKGPLSSSVENKMWDANRNTAGRVEVMCCSHEANSLMTRLAELKRVLAKRPYKIGILVVVISDESQYPEILSKLNTVSESEGNNRLVLCVLKDGFTDNQLDEWHHSVTHRELASEEGKRASAASYETEAELVIEKWAGAATDGQLAAFYMSHQYPLVYGKDDLRKRIEDEVLYSVFPYAPERIVTQNTAFKKTQQEKAALFAITGNEDAANMQIKNIATALEKNGVWGAASLQDIVAAGNSAGAKAVSELARYLSNELSVGAKVKLDGLWETLGRKPFGYYDNLASAFLLGFILRFYREGQSNFKWIDAVDNRHLLTDQNLAKMISEMCKGNAINHILSSGTEIWQKFNDYPKKIFGLSDAAVASEDKAVISIKAIIDKTGVPLWAFKYIDEGRLGGAEIKSVIDKAADAFDAFISDGSNREDAMSEVVDTFKGKGAARQTMTNVFADATELNDAFRNFMFSNEPALMEISAEIGLTAADLHEELAKFMQASVYAWTENQVKDKLPELLTEYKVVILLNRASGVRKKNLSALRAELVNAFAKMPEQILRERITAFLDDHPEFLKRFLDEELLAAEGDGASSFADAEAEAGEIISFPHRCIIIKIRKERIEQTGSVYDAVRWRPKARIERARKAEYVLAVVQGHVEGVFKPTLWYNATYENAMKYGGVAYETDLVYHEKIRDELLQNQVGGRIGFEGVEAESGVAALYLGKRIPQPHWSSQNPVNYTYEIDGMAKGNADSADDSHEPRYERAHDQDAYMSAEDTSQGDDEFAEDSSAQGNPFGNKSNVATPTLPLSELFAGEHDLTFYRLKLRECIEGVNHKRHDSGALFRAATVAINNIDRYNASKRIAQDGVDKLFPPPQLAHDRYYRELSKYDSEFLSHVRKATSIIWIVTEVTGKIDVQLRKSLEAITQISKKLEEFSIEIALKIGNTKDGSVSADIEELVDAMQKLIDSLKEYE